MSVVYRSIEEWDDWQGWQDNEKIGNDKEENFGHEGNHVDQKCRQAILEHHSLDIASIGLQWLILRMLIPGS